MTPEQDGARREFVAEAEELLEALSSDLLEFEGGCKTGAVKPALVNRIFRNMHSLKGLAGMLGFQRVSDLSHDLEDLLDRLRLGKVQPSQDMVDMLFQAVETLGGMVRSIAGCGEEGGANIAGLLARIKGLAEGKKESGEASLDWLTLDEGTRKSLTEYEEHRLLDNLRQGKAVSAVSLAFGFDVFDVELKKVTDLLNDLGEVVSTLPSSDPAAGPDKLCFRLLFAGAADEAALRSAVAPFGGKCESIMKGGSRPTAPAPAAAAPAATPQVPAAPAAAPSEPAGEEEAMGGEDGGEGGMRSASHTVRVDIEKLDAVMNIVGELVVSKTAILRLSRQVQGETGFTPATFELVKSASVLDRKLAALQEAVIEVRMVPIGQIFNKLSRGVRKILAQKKDKKVELRFLGGDTELDKMMIEEITSPLLHLLRNAIDHGIEPEAERLAAGKPAAGQVVLHARQKGNAVVIDIADDGGGIRRERIRDVAVQRGLVKPGQDLSLEECIQLMFTPGFSSAREVSEISGRGVGLDVVKSNLASLKGSVQVTSEPGRGTTFSVQLPITLAILRVLLVRVGEKRFAIPLASVNESLRIQERDIRRVERREVYHLRDATIPLLRLGEFFRFREGNGGNGAAHAPDGKLYIVVVQSAERRMGLVVDRLAGEQEVVIKSAGKLLSGMPGIAGVCELGENELVLVLDVGSLLEKGAAARSAAAPRGPEPAGKEAR